MQNPKIQTNWHQLFSLKTILPTLPNKKGEKFLLFVILFLLCQKIPKTMTQCQKINLPPASQMTLH